ncbi:MAG: maltose alpha-D-glucosyltransferase [Pseudolabrys sp.]
MMSSASVSPTSTPVAQQDDELWYKDAIIYQLHVKAFADSNGDGVGDFAGLSQRLDYLQELGVTTLWLLPFYPSPGRDDGYDIADYGDINPAFGTMKDFRRFMHEAKRRNLRVITELVVNHTSDEHPWFKRARRSPSGSSARNWYVWSDTDQKYQETRIIFTDTEKSNWAWDDTAQAYYWHRFFSHQPDLNFDNPRVVSAVVQVMKRWLDTGVDGFRLDAVPYLRERDGTNNENLPETHEILKILRSELDAYAPNKVLLAEANQWPEDVQHYFGDGDECHMAYHFPLMPRIYMAIAQEDRFPIADIMRQTPDIPANCQWAMFLRNHDELTLEMVTDSERDYLWTTYAANPRARINLGIRRRLAPLMDNDRRKIELMNSLLFSMPGTPIIYYGDEIGMGDNIYLGDRNGVRTPMQWTPDRNGGFSRADPAQLYLPCIMDPIYGYNAVNVEAQASSLSSLLSWMKRLIAVRKSSKVFGRGTLTFIRPKNRAVLVYARQYTDDVIICVANLSRSAQFAEIDLSPWKGRIPLEMLGRTRFPRIGDLPYLVTLPPYGFFWFQLTDDQETQQEPSLPRELTTLVMRDGWEALLTGRARRSLEADVLPGFLQERRWFAGKSAAKVDTILSQAIPLEHADDRFLLTVIDTQADESLQRYQLPLTIRWERHDRVPCHPSAVLAAVRRGPREGTLLDSAGEREFVSMLLAKLQDGETITAHDARLVFTPTETFKMLPVPHVASVNSGQREQSNTTLTIEHEYVVKLLRRLQAGQHPEIEMGRFLSDEAPFANAPQMLGSLELIENGEPTALAIVHRYVENQGDAWQVVTSALARYAEEQRILTNEKPTDSAEREPLLHRIRQIGRRTAELHQTLASRADIPAFAPDPVTSHDFDQWRDRLLAHAELVFEQLSRRTLDSGVTEAESIKELARHHDRVIAYVQSLAEIDPLALKIRHHGDLHLGQILIAKDDAFILDFEGEPQRSLAERRQKAPAARDVAGLVRSIDYAAASAITALGDMPADERRTLADKLGTLRDELTVALWEGYREGLTDQRLWPAEEEGQQELLAFFELEKALYEIEYEIENRPDWLHIPVGGVIRILQRAGVWQP